MKPKISIALALLFFTAHTWAADDARLREVLKNTMLQLRTIQTERDNLQAAQAELEQKNKTLDAQVKKLTKESADDKAIADKKISDLEKKSEDQAAQLAQLKDARKRRRPSVRKSRAKSAI
jgi:septal ring factor EnvC (AmiA/AmiB activator)